MARTTVEKKALDLFNTFERSGKAVVQVTVEGRKIELMFGKPAEIDEFDRIDMRHDET